ncbi:MAG: MoaD/ThiS family protein [Negativicutes bacterium]|nr:MoaD/ThiS family protein [Negativicutes bacterium]
MAGNIELRAFMYLAQLFQKRKWPSPLLLEIGGPTTGLELLVRLDISRDSVEVIFINGKVFPPDDAVIQPGDRVALAPPGVPGPYRALLGFKKLP